jgi:zinc transport system substrate-binding protein
MPRFLIYIFLLLMVSCKSHDVTDHQDIITVSISPFRYFVEALAGDDFSVNVMVPSEADPHIYEPVPGQVSALKMSKAYISDGYLGFELAWLKRFYGVNKTMKRLTLGDSIDLIKGGEHDNDSHVEGADPHFWISPRCAIRIAESVKSLLCDLKPENKEKYERNCVQLEDSIKSIDQKASQLLAGFKGRSFMIFHPSLAYLARDYDLNQIAVESEGKEPSVLSMKNLIDIAKARDIRTIFVQRGFDMRNAGSIASETGADLKVIDPMSPDWPGSVWQIITALHDSFLIKTDN